MVTEFVEQISAEFVTEFGASPNSSLNSVQNSALFPSPAGIAHIPLIHIVILQSKAFVVIANKVIG